MKQTLLILIAMAVLQPVFSSDPLIIAHRGASYLAPENTLAAVNLAWKLGARAVEVDVHLSSDGRIMVMHDKNTRHTTGKNLEIAGTSSLLLRELDAGSWKDTSFAGEKIPYLEEVLATVPENGTLFIEVKCGTEILPVLKQTLEKSRKMTAVTIISFDFEVARGAKQLMPHIPAYFLHYTLTGRYGRRWINRAREASLDGLNLRHRGITRRYADKVHQAGMKIYAWTVDDPATAIALAGMGVDGITTNRPAWLKEQCRFGN